MPQSWHSMRHPHLISLFLALLCACVWQGTACAASAAEPLVAPSDPILTGESATRLRRARASLKRMELALRSRNYHGVLVYARGDQLETLDFMHRIEDGQIVEQVVSLSGPVRVVVRTPRRLTYAQPGRHHTAAENGSATRLFDSSGIDPALLQPHYRIVLDSVGRVAGRTADLVEILPRDDARYGYRLYIDRETSLPLKSDLVDRSGNVLEQIMFTTIDLLPSSEVIAETRKHALRQATPADYSGDWQLTDQPPGFELVLHRTGPTGNGSGRVEDLEQFLFTDRLSSYSIYIEPDHGSGLTGTASIGAVNAAGRRIGGYQVTAVGEVPLVTVQQALDGVSAP